MSKVKSNTHLLKFITTKS